MKWLFVLGCNNSGTTLLAHLLGLHPSVDPLTAEGGEAYPRMCPGHWASKHGDSLSRAYTENTSLFREPNKSPVNVDPEWLKQEWLNMRATTGGEYTLEKTPVDSIRAPWLEKHFTPAWFVCIARDPVAVAEGTKRKKGCSLDRAVRHVAETYRILAEDSRSLRNVLWVEYERLTKCTEKTLAYIEMWLSIPPHDWSGIRSVEHDFGIRHLPPNRIINMNPRSYAKLTPAQIDIIRDGTKEIREIFGYED